MHYWHFPIVHYPTLFMPLPTLFIEQMRALLPQDDYKAFEAALGEPSPVSIRLNPFKRPRQWPDYAASALFGGSSTVAWAQDGFYLDRRPSFTSDPLFHQGAYYVQEASSMFVEQAIKTALSLLDDSKSNESKFPTPHLAIDLCAAPGGKSTLLRSLLPQNWLLLSNDLVRPRAEVLKQNMMKWGHEEVVVTCNRPQDIGRLAGMADIMLVDAPCSGEGMFRKEEKAVSQWSPTLVEECARRQREILNAAWPALKEGGFLIYSTCTFNTLEDEQNIRYICEQLGGEVVAIPTQEEWNITGSLLKGFTRPVYRFLPHRTRGEGFFLALIRKTAPAQSAPINNSATRIKGKGGLKPAKSKLTPLGKSDRSLLATTDDYLLFPHSDEEWAVPAVFAQYIETMCRTLYPLSAGIALHTLKGRKQLPHQALALSRLINTGAMPTVALSREDAIQYLHYMPLKISAPRGFVLLTHEGLGLGFCNNIGTRANNLYPKEWRILK